MSTAMFQADEKSLIHWAACAMVSAATRDDALPGVEILGGLADREVCGSFITLRREGQLRSCYGTYGGPFALGEALQGAAFGAAKKDPRFPPISSDELTQLYVEVSVLHSIEAVTASSRDRAAALEIGRHGLTIRKGPHGGLLLPRVAVDMQLNAESFLQQLCRKANLPLDAWLEPDTQLQTFQAQCIGRPFDIGAISS